jgi:hypothetical protein
MKRILYSILLVTFVSILEARPVPNWTYQMLFDEADSVFVVTAKKSTDLTDYLKPKGYSGPVEAFQTDFEILGVFKGKQKTNLKITFYRLPKSNVLIINGPSFAEIDTKENNRYLIFLKDGHPVSGDMDSVYSIHKLESWTFIP